MISARLLRVCALASCLVLLLLLVPQWPPNLLQAENLPVLGQEGKDVIWVPTEQALVDKMLNLAKLTPQDTLIDLGSGDGRIVITAAKWGARALGIEYNPELVALSRRYAARAGVSDKARFVEADIFASDLSPATVITLFLLTEVNLRLRPILLDLKAGTRIVSNSFDMGEWQPDQRVVVTREEGCDSPYCEAFLWIVPAKVEGRWRTDRGELLLKQSFQMLSGTLRIGADRRPIAGGSLSGDRIRFTAGGILYTGRVLGQSMEGSALYAGKNTPWRAERIR